MKKIAALFASVAFLAGCSNLTPAEQNLGIGAAGGAAGGAVLGAIGGNAGLGTAVGAGAGLLGGLLYNHYKQGEQNAYRQGYSAGQASAPAPTYSAPVYQPPPQ
jgi:hypothetical protein